MCRSYHTNKFNKLIYNHNIFCLQFFPFFENVVHDVQERSVQRVKCALSFLCIPTHAVSCNFKMLAYLLCRYAKYCLSMSSGSCMVASKESPYFVETHFMSVMGYWHHTSYHYNSVFHRWRVQTFQQMTLTWLLLDRGKVLNTSASND